MDVRSGQTKQVEINSAEGVIPSNQPNLPGQAVHVSSKAPQEPLAGARITGKADSSPKESSSPPSVVVQGVKCPPRSTLHPWRHTMQVFTDVSSEGWGTHLEDFTASGSWSVPKSRLHRNFLELKAVLLALKGFQHVVRQIVLVATQQL